MKETIRSILLHSASLKQKLAEDAAFLSAIEKATQLCKKAIQSGGTIYSCGNGGSACDAMHLTEELVARYKRERPGIKAMHFADPGTLTCWGNDYDYESAYEREATTFCGPNDLLIGISTSGNSKNILRAVQAAKKKKCPTVGLLGKNGGIIAPECDLALIVPEQLTERIQEIHITLVHIILELIETT